MAVFILLFVKFSLFSLFCAISVILYYSILSLLLIQMYFLGLSAISVFLSLLLFRYCLFLSWLSSFTFSQVSVFQYCHFSYGYLNGCISLLLSYTIYLLWSACLTLLHLLELSVIIEPPRGKTNNVVSKQVRHKPACTATEAG